MIDIAYLDRIRLVARPPFQSLVGPFVRTPNYHWFANVDIRLEGLENIPRGRNVILATNHTDRFEAVTRLVMERIEFLVADTHRTPADAP